MPHYDPFAILGLSAEATDSEIKSAYKRLAKIHHPDKGGKAEAFDRVQKAYDLLMNPAKRQMWQETGEEPGGQSADAKRQQALMELLMLHLDAALTEDEFTPLRGEMQKTLREHRKALDGQIDGLQGDIAKLTKRRERLSGTGLVQDILSDRQRKKEAELVFRQLEGQLLSEAQEIVAALEEQPAPERPPATSDDISRQMTDIWRQLASVRNF